ncbi:MAG TPA: hypothetical protein PK530_04155 [Anaerolineales bacterium]|nr:hypothetical protein [Anaerolineales bacterium]
MDDTIIICLDEVARQVAQKYAKEHIHSVGEYLDLSETELRQRADEFSMLWYQANGKDYSTFEGLSTGELLIVEVTYKALFELEKMIVLIQKIIQVHLPTSWLLATNENPLFAQVIRAHANPAPIAQIAPNRMAWARRNLNFRELKLWLRQNGWDYHFRAATFRLLNLLRKTAPPAKTERGRVLFILDIPTSSAMDTLLPVIKEVPPEERLILASDPRCYSLIQQAGLEGYPFSPEALNVPLPQKKLATSREIHQCWEGLRAEKEANGSQLVFRGVDLWDIRAPYFKNQFLRKIPIALAQFQLALAVLKTYQVRAIVSATDNHYMGQLFVRAAQTMNLYFLTIQHGMVNHPAGYLPIRGSQLAVMGEAVREWLINHGAPPEKVVVTGQPRFDALVTPPDLTRKSLLQELELSPNRPTWLIAPEPQLGLWMRDLIFRTLERIPDVQAIIRVHPNDNPLDYQVSLNAYPPLLSRVRIARHHDIKSALNGCDVIVLGRSTIGLEALIMGKYPIVILPENSTGWILPPYLQDYLAIAPYLAANTPEGIAEAWKILCTQETSALDALRQKIVTQYACSNDGKNAYRVAQLLRKEIH